VAGWGWGRGGKEGCRDVGMDGWMDGWMDEVQHMTLELRSRHRFAVA
jgi:hypothetical protein